MISFNIQYCLTYINKSKEEKKSFDDFDDALDYAYSKACELYKKFPLKTVDQIMEEQECSVKEAKEEFDFLMENNIEFFAFQEDENIILDDFCSEDYLEED